MSEKIVSDAGTNIVSEKFQEFYRFLDIYHAIPSSCNHERNGQEESCIKFVKHII